VLPVVCQVRFIANFLGSNASERILENRSVLVEVITKTRFWPTLYNRSEVGTLHLGRVWWKVNVHPIFDWTILRVSIKMDKFVRCTIVIDYERGTSGFWNYTEVLRSYIYVT